MYSFEPIIELKTLVDSEKQINIQASFYYFIDDKKELELDYLTKLITGLTAC